MGKIKGFLFAVRNREILMTDLGLSIHEEMYTDYVLQVINLHRKTLRENKVGSAIPHLNKKLFKAINVPIPPYEEQKRIVNAINQTFTILDTIAVNL